MRKLLLLILLLLPCTLWSQDQTQTVLLVNGTPTGACPARKLAVDYANNLLYFCSNSVWVLTTSGGGSGTVTSFSAGTLSPIFSTSVATATTTPALSFALTNAAAGTVLGNATGSAAGPTYTAVPKLGVNGTTQGKLTLEGLTTGELIITTQSAAGTPTWTAGTSSGTPVVTASAPLAITTATGNLVVTGVAGAVLAGSTPAFTTTPTLGVANTTLGTLSLTGGTSGTVLITPQAAAGSPTLTLPTGTGTFATTASSPLALSATTGALTCATCATTSAGGALTLDQVGSPAANWTPTLTASNSISPTASVAGAVAITLTNTSNNAAAQSVLIVKNDTGKTGQLFINSSTSAAPSTVGFYAETGSLQFYTAGVTSAFIDTSHVFGVGNTTAGSDPFRVTAAGAVTALSVASSGAVSGTGITGTSYNFTHLIVSGTAPTVSSGFGTGASITASNGTAAFRVGVGTTSGNTGVIGLPTATAGWNCFANDITTQSTAVAYTKQTASSTTSATLANFSDIAVAGPWVDSDVLAVSCFAY